MSDEILMDIAWGFLFCTPAAIVLFAWYLIDERRKK